MPPSGIELMLTERRAVRGAVPEEHDVAGSRQLRGAVPRRGDAEVGNSIEVVARCRRGSAMPIEATCTD